MDNYSSFGGKSESDGSQNPQPNSHFVKKAMMQHQRKSKIHKVDDSL